MKALDLNILHHQKVRSRLTRNVVQHDNIRVIQGRYRLCLAPESGQSLCIPGYLIGQKLQSHKAMQPRILGFVDHTHPTTAELLNDAVVRDGLADHAQECYGGSISKSMKPEELAVFQKGLLAKNRDCT